MPSTRIFLSALVAILALLPSPVLGQARTVDVRASVGYAYLLDDSPPYAWVGGGTVTVPRGVHSRFGVEGWYASLFGPYNHPGKAQARLVTALWEYAFSPGQRVNPYAVVGVGVTQYRDWYVGARRASTASATATRPARSAPCWSRRKPANAVWVQVCPKRPFTTHTDRLRPRLEGGRLPVAGLDSCVRALRTGDVLVVWKLDRLGRSLAHLINTAQAPSACGLGLRVLTGQGAQIDTTTAAGRLVFGIFAALAEFERELRREVERRRHHDADLQRDTLQAAGVDAGYSIEGRAVRQ